MWNNAKISVYHMMWLTGPGEIYDFFQIIIFDFLCCKVHQVSVLPFPISPLLYAAVCYCSVEPAGKILIYKTFAHKRGYLINKRLMEPNIAYVKPR